MTSTNDPGEDSNFQTLDWSDWCGNSEDFLCAYAQFDRHEVRICRWRYSHSVGYELSLRPEGGEAFGSVCSASSSNEELDTVVQDVMDRTATYVMVSRL